MDSRRPFDVSGAALGTAVLIGTGALARRNLTPTETRVFRWANRLPDDVFRAIWLPMQYGTFGTVPALAALALARRRFGLASAVAAAGTTAWVLAKAAKPVVGRGRPASILKGRFEEARPLFAGGRAIMEDLSPATFWS